MKKSFDELFYINPKVSTSVSFILGLLLTSDLSVSEQNLVGNWIIMLGQTILTNASCQSVIESKINNNININSNEIKSIYNPFIYDINTIKSIVSKFNKETDIIMDMIKDLETKINEIKK